MYYGLKEGWEIIGEKFKLFIDKFSWQEAVWLSSAQSNRDSVAYRCSFTGCLLDLMLVQAERL